MEKQFIKEAIHTIQKQDNTITQLTIQLNEERHFSANLRESLEGQYELFEEVVGDLIKERDALREQKGVMALGTHYKVVEGYTQNEDIILEGMDEIIKFFPTKPPHKLLEYLSNGTKFIDSRDGRDRIYKIVPMTSTETHIYFVKEMLASSEKLTNTLKALSATIE